MKTATDSNSPAHAIEVQRIDHVAIVVTDLEQSRRFFGEAMGLKEIPRPPSFDFPGAWFAAGSEVLHLLAQPNMEAPGGRRHLCFWVRDVHSAARRLAAFGFSVGWEHTYKIEGIDRFFTADPDNNRVEIQGPELGLIQGDSI
jgi:catechol 2,3-dioxygenase-like lactoylglutathione lyase family enzyme